MNELNISIFDSYKEMSEQAANWIATTISSVLKIKERCVFVPSAGRTPKVAYSLLSQKYKNCVDWSRVTVVQMDEYLSKPCKIMSFASAIRTELIEPLNIKDFRTLLEANERAPKCLIEYEKNIIDLGGIDVVLHGIGVNGHIGFNEPGSSRNSFTRLVTLELSTLQHNIEMLNIDDYEVSQIRGITIGLKTLLNAKNTLLIASGQEKIRAINSLLSDEISEKCPATFLRTLERVSLMLVSDCVPQKLYRRVVPQ